MPHHVKATMSQVFSLQVLLPDLKVGTASNDAVAMCKLHKYWLRNEEDIAGSAGEGHAGCLHCCLPTKLGCTTMVEIATKHDCHRHVRESTDLSRQCRDGCNNKLRGKLCIQ